MDETLKFLATLLVSFIVSILTYRVAVKNAEHLGNREDADTLATLQKLVDDSTKSLAESERQRKEQKSSYEEAIKKQKEDFETRIKFLEEQIKVLMQGDLKIELVIGDSPARAKSVKIEHFMSIPSGSEVDVSEHK